MKTLLLFFFMLLPAATMADNTIYLYTYDASGNCTRIKLASAPSFLNGSGNSEESVNAEVGERQVSVSFDNRTLTVDVLNWSDSDTGFFTVYGSDGRQLMASQPALAHSEIDVSSLKNDLYILRLNLNGEDTGIRFAKHQ